MSYQSRVIDKYIESNDAVIYVQIDKSLYSDNSYLINILGKLRDSYVSDSKQIILIKTDEFAELQEIINFDDSNTSVSRDNFKTYSLLKPHVGNLENLKYTLNVYSCDPIPKFEFMNDEGNIKIKKSFIYTPKSLKNDWVVTIDFIKIVKNTDINLIEWYKTNIFNNINVDTIDSILSTQASNLISQIDVKIKYCGAKNKINDSIHLMESMIKEIFINESFVNDKEYKEYVYEIAKYMITDNVYLKNFKYKYGLKQLSNQVIDLNKNIYYNNVIHNITDYYLTDKIDGQRCMVYITEYYNGETDIKIVADKIYYIDVFIINNDVNTKKITIFDAELLYDGNLSKVLNHKKIKLFIFDLIVLENKNVSNLPFEKRLKLMKEHSIKVSSKGFGVLKKFIQLTNNHEEEIKSFYNQSKQYDIDGLIFTPSSKISTLHLHNKSIRINSNYKNMIVYKWKPIELLTIDFYVRSEGSEGKYILFSGINKKDFDKLRLHYIDNYKTIVPSEYHNKELFPIQFMPSDDPNAYIFHYNGKENINGKVGEFSYDVNNKKWNLIRLRLDREDDVSRGTYFGNYYKIAESIWNNIKNPLTIQNLTSPENKKYFKVDYNDTYKAQRNFNSFVKSMTFNKIEDKDWIIDLAAGKGQDLQRIANLGFKNSLFIDNDEAALGELIERKYTIKSHGMKINTKKLDLTVNYNTIVKELKVFNLPQNGVDVIICNFALHYFTNTHENILNIIKLVNHLLKPNGIFIFTTFNGESIFNKLQNVEVFDLEENGKIKYSIKKQYLSQELTNLSQQIGVLLPFSDSEYYSEYLVNIPYILNEFAQNEFNIIESKSFNELLPQYKEQNAEGYKKLTNVDKEYTGLYQYNILQKTVVKTGKNSGNSTNILVILTIPDCNLDQKKRTKLVTNFLKHLNTHFTSLGYTNEDHIQSINMFKVILVDIKNNPDESLYNIKYDDEKLFNLAYNYANKEKYSTVVFQNINFIPTFEYFYYYTYQPTDLILLPYDHTSTVSYKNGDLNVNGVVIMNTVKFNQFPIKESDNLNIDKYNVIFNKQLINLNYISKDENNDTEYKIDKIEKRSKYVKIIIDM